MEKVTSTGGLHSHLSTSLQRKVWWSGKRLVYTATISIIYYHLDIVQPVRIHMFYIGGCDRGMSRLSETAPAFVGHSD